MKVCIGLPVYGLFSMLELLLLLQDGVLLLKRSMRLNIKGFGLGILRLNIKGFERQISKALVFERQISKAFVFERQISKALVAQKLPGHTPMATQCKLDGHLNPQTA